MAEGRDRSLWIHTSSLLAMMANVNRDVKRRRCPYVPAEFDRYATEQEIAAQRVAARQATGLAITPDTFEALKTLVAGNRGQGG